MIERKEVVASALGASTPLSQHQRLCNGEAIRNQAAPDHERRIAVQPLSCTRPSVTWVVRWSNLGQDRASGGGKRSLVGPKTAWACLSTTSSDSEVKPHNIIRLSGMCKCASTNRPLPLCLAVMSKKIIQDHQLKLNLCVCRDENIAWESATWRPHVTSEY